MEVNRPTFPVESTVVKLAVPHAAVSCVDSIVAAVGLSRRGIPFDSLDGGDARLIVLLVIPRGRFQSHLRTLTGIAKLASDTETREKLLASASADEVMRHVYEHDEGLA